MINSAAHCRQTRLGEPRDLTLSVQLAGSADVHVTTIPGEQVFDELAARRAAGSAGRNG
jgi:hypothetical protein